MKSSVVRNFIKAQPNQKWPAAFLRIKTSEINAIYKLCGKTAPTIKDFKTYLTAKWRGFEILKQQWRESIPPFEAAFTENQKYIAGHSLISEYQRYEVAVVGPKKSKLIYDRLVHPKGFKCETYFSNSGSAAIVTFFEMLRSELNTNRILAPWDVYWETYSFLKTHGFEFSQKKSHALYFDSSMLDQKVNWTKIESNIRGCVAIGIDTTCWPQDSKYIGQFCRLAAKHKKPLVLLRSHLKLDQLGSEISRIGSLVAVVPPSQSSENILKNLKLSVSFFGGYPRHESLYPFMFSQKFRKLTVKWNKRVAKTQSLVVNNIRSEKVKVVKFEHQQFFWIVIRKTVNEQLINKELNRLSSAFKVAQLPAARLASYSWDFIALAKFTSTWANRHHVNKQYVLRVAVPDMPEAQALEVANVINWWLKTL